MWTVHDSNSEESQGLGFIVNLERAGRIEHQTLTLAVMVLLKASLSRLFAPVLGDLAVNKAPTSCELMRFNLTEISQIDMVSARLGLHRGGHGELCAINGAERCPMKLLVLTAVMVMAAPAFAEPAPPAPPVPGAPASKNTKTDFTKPFVDDRLVQQAPSSQADHPSAELKAGPRAR